MRYATQDADSPDAGSTVYDVKIRHFACDEAGGVAFLGLHALCLRVVPEACVVRSQSKLVCMCYPGT